MNKVLPAAGLLFFAILFPLPAATEAELFSEAESYYLQRQASKAYVEPEEIAETILFLASDKAKSITGQFIGLDGAFD